jgi:hypothetical protein
MPPRAKVLKDGAKGRQESLSVTGRFESLHATLGSCTRQLRIIISPPKPGKMPPSHHTLKGAMSWYRIIYCTNSPYSVVSLNSVYGYERAISENVRGKLLMHDTRSASGGSHGVHHMLLS